MRLGRIELLDRYENVIRYGSYNTRPRRREIIDMWKKEYANRLDGCCIHIIPDDKYVEQTVNEKTGMNCRKDYKERKKSK